MKTYKQTSLKNYHSFHIEVQAEQLIVFQNEEEVRSYFSKQNAHHPNTMIIGEGSNLLFTKAFEGVIYKIENKGIEVIEDIGDYVWVKAAAGEHWDDLVAWAVGKGYGGIENLSLIPGTVGAAPVQNIGAYGVEFSQVFNSLEAVEMNSGDPMRFYLQELNFGYRKSSFKQELKNKYLITSVVVKLRKYPKLNIEYGRLKSVAQAMSGKDYTDIADIRAAVIKIREEKLPNPDKIGNAGSFFKNPIVDLEHFNKISSKHPNIVSYPLENMQYKLAAAWLIEEAGFKGSELGRAAVHAHHALILINKGEALGKDVYELSKRIQESVFQKFEIQLEPEVMIL
jgi:UDP-N-acetylmuramate dehydrogenase